MLFFIQRRDRAGPDEALAFVVRAPDSAAARGLAGEACGDEGPDLWFDPAFSSCDPVTDQGPEGVLLRSYRG